MTTHLMMRPWPDDGEGTHYALDCGTTDCGAAGPGTGAADAASAGDPADAPLSALDGRGVRRCQHCGCVVDEQGRGQHSPIIAHPAPAAESSEGAI